ncbi:MAG: CHAT domain-containing protein, partial [Bacteroidota bacterium]
TTQLRLGEELRDVREGLLRSRHRDKFDLESRSAVRVADFYRAMLDESPNIVHFSGHGETTSAGSTDVSGTRALTWKHKGKVVREMVSGIVMEDPNGSMKLVPHEALGELFEELNRDRLVVQCVLLNACHSAVQAEVIKAHVPYLIGMNQAVPDRTAIAFATAFYDGLGSGKDIPTAFRLARTYIRLEGLPGSDIPVLMD